MKTLSLPTAFALFAAFVVTSSAAEMFPFVLPWDDASPSITNLSSWLEKPAGRDGFVTVKDGHLFANGKRFRIFGVNMCFGANFPKHEDAEKIAARMAKFGINCVRFHHMDMLAAPGGIWAKDMRTLDAGQLDKLDYFIAALKKNGIYSDLNLHVSRTYPDRPKAEKAGNEQFDKGVDNFSAAMIALQKDYARDLLTHVNPYTKTAYIDEPAVALIEINNENALLSSWHYGSLDEIAAPYREELTSLWLKWLREKYPTDEKLLAAWKDGAREGGAELLGGKWFFEQHESAKARGVVKDGAITFTVDAPGTDLWHAQFSSPGLKLVEGEKYTVSFRVRAPQAMSATVNLMQAHEPWKVLGSSRFEMTKEWTEVRATIAASAGDENARLGITGLGLTAGAFEFADFSLRTAALDASLPRTAFTQTEYASRTLAAQRDWFAFLWSLEEKYWPGMYSFIREELKARSLIVGTQLGWSPFPIQQKMDVIDSHAYWQHPDFHGKGWGSEGWTVKNIPMAGREDGGTLPGLALQRVAGKPYICTEYSHPAPNEYAGEGFPLICAYAALQDWDGIFAFAYSHRTDDWDQRYFSSFFDIDQHPVKMATLPASLAMFMRGDVRASRSFGFAAAEPSKAVEIARTDGPRIGGDRFLLPEWGANPLKYRVGIELSKPGFIQTPNETTAFVDEAFTWKSESSVPMVESTRSYAAIGIKAGQHLEFGWRINRGSPRSSPEMREYAEVFTAVRSQDWATIQLTVIDGDTFSSASRILITATGRAANTDMKWTSDAHESVGKNWGRAPSLVEGIAAKITLPISGKKMRAWALDERGQRREEIPFTDGILEIGPQYRTLWYEVTVD